MWGNSNYLLKKYALANSDIIDIWLLIVFEKL